jgi:hypothetical protein
MDVDVRHLTNIVDRICSRLQDEEDTVSDLAKKCLFEIWFDDSLDKHQKLKNTKLIALSGSTTHYRELSLSDREFLSTYANYLLDFINSSKGAADIFGDFLMSLLRIEKDQSATVFKNQIKTAYTCVSYIECIMDQMLQNDFKGLHALMQFARAFPHFLVPYVSSLSVYLSQKNVNESLKIGVLQILSQVLPHTTAPDILNDLLIIIDRGSLNLVIHAVPCLCALETKLGTYDNSGRLLVKCLGILSAKPNALEFLKKVADAFKSGQNVRPAILNACRCLIILGLLVKHLDFDSLKSDHKCCFLLAYISSGCPVKIPKIGRRSSLLNAHGIRVLGCTDD